MTIKTVTPNDLYRRMKLGHNVVLVDIRSQREFVKGHIPGATFYPLEVFDAKALIHKACIPFPDQPTIYITCANGFKSREAYRRLESARYPYVVILKGGMKAWNAGAFPVNTIDLPPSPHPMKLKQQKQIAMGLIVTLGTLLGIFLHPSFLLVSLIAGIGSIYEGIFGTDYLKEALLKLSWNRNN